MTGHPAGLTRSVDKVAAVRDVRSQFSSLHRCDQRYLKAHCSLSVLYFTFKSNSFLIFFYFLFWKPITIKAEVLLRKGKINLI